MLSLLKLHQGRKTREDKQAEIAAAREALSQVPEYITLLRLQTELSVIDDVLKALRADVIEEGMARYRESQDKRVAPGVNVRCNTVVLYDELLAEAWCMQHYTIAMKLDKGIFEAQMRHLSKSSKDNQRIPPFVEISEEHTIAIATDLEPYLGLLLEGDEGGDDARYSG